MADAESTVSADGPDYIDELTGLAEPTQSLMFSSSNTILTKPDPNMHPMGQAIGVFLLFICLLGFLNGADYATPNSGLVRPDEFVYRLSLTAPDETATFRGVVYDDEGQPLENATLYISWDDNGIWNSTEMQTDSNGFFNFERLDPGLARVDVLVERDGYRDVYSNRVLFSPPAMIEPIGFTTIDFTIPSQEDFAQEPCSNGAEECEIRYIDLTEGQMDHPLMDPGASSIYVTIGFAFMGLALIGTGFTVWAMKSGSIPVLRTAAGISFFGMGHYYTACCFGIVAFVLTFAVPKRYVPMNEEFR
jgi:hypothetical protein